MILIKPKFWDQKIGIYSLLLLPLTWIYLALISLKKIITKEKIFKIPIICVGNIYIGGTGKTPLSIMLAKELLNLGLKPVILRKYYKNHADEYSLIKKYFKNLITEKTRIKGLEALDNNNFNIAILDDGLQDFSFKKNIKIVCFNSNQKAGNGLVLPSGPLRERLDSLEKVDLVIINGNKDQNFEEKILKINKDINIFYSSYKPININEFKNKDLLVVVGIGNPENFIKLIETNELKIKKKLIYPDHHIFSKKEIEDIVETAEENDLDIIMTEKDYYKVKKFNLKKINYLKVSLEIPNKEKLLGKIKELYDKNI